MVVTSEDTPQGTVPPPDALQRNKEAHRVIPEVLRALEEARQPQKIVETIDALWSVLSGHFSEEEEPDGLFAELVEARPANHSRIKSLEREHGQILESVEELRQQARDLEQHPNNRFEEDKVALSNRIQRHEQIETSLVMDTYLVDEGGAG
jgi:hemerythrin-like domain-containing protein